MINSFNVSQADVLPPDIVLVSKDVLGFDPRLDAM